MKGVEGGGSDEEFGFGFVKLNPFRGWKRGMEEVSSLLEEEVQRAGSGGVSWNIYSISEWVWGGGEGKCPILEGLVKIIEKEQHLAALVPEFRWYAL